MRTPIAALVAVAALALPSCAEVGKRAAVGAEQSLRESQATSGEGAGPAEVAGQRMVRGAVQEIGSPETTEGVGLLVDAAVQQSLASVHHEFAGGRGRLARDLGATADRASSSAVEGVHRELTRVMDEAFLGCGALDRRTCLHREIHALGEEASAGFMDGILGSHIWTLGAIVFISGIVAALLARLAWDIVVARSRSMGHDERS